MPAYGPTTFERDMELILLGMMFGGSAKRVSAIIGRHAAYKSDVEGLVAILKSGKSPLSSDRYCAEWLAKRGIVLNGEPVVDMVARLVNENGKRRATNEVVTKGACAQQLNIPGAIEKMQSGLKEIGP